MCRAVFLGATGYHIGVLIPLDSLSPDTLRRVLEEYVTRDGTDLADVDVKVEQVLRQLRAGRAELHFDEETETTTVVSKAPR